MKPQVKRRAHNWYALKPKSELLSMSKVIYQCSVNGVIGKAGKAVALCGKHKIKGGCGAHGNTKCAHKVVTNEIKVKP
ncbi:hypothetical protein PTRA_a1418 [Pseudoalteromonas translucida KMM 520]|uniref:Uncharacterized protein n=1 Tax=Pseudoalteromonas translucida KMM 520 TaxID=1315283 RepID=A0A0U2WH77_9GAMM|nr:hypothetical protein [Pseudoalteromonas translucida]ALS32634.1 hypothetical protein PTRA_a1418 [Pseudoalteromonas translucida KMM 520]